MNNAYFTLSKKSLLNQIKTLEDLRLKVSYSYKTNKEVGNILQEISPSTNFSIHAEEEIDMIKDKSKISFFTQAESLEELTSILEKGIRHFVVDNTIDLENILEAAQKSNTKINLSIRMKFQEHRVGSGKYFVYGLPSKEVKNLIQKLKDIESIEKIGVHIHRKSQNTSEWEIKDELIDSLGEESLKIINSVNIGGGLPSVYRSSSEKVFPYIFKKLTETKKFLDEKNIEMIIEPGRFIAAPPIKLHTKIIQIQGNNIIINTTIYNCAIDTILTGTKMLLEEELSENEEGEYYLIKGNSPTRDDIFRYKIKLKNPKIGENLTFRNAGAYNYTTDFFGYKKLETIVTD